jgi:hypothetical protein
MIYLFKIRPFQHNFFWQVIVYIHLCYILHSPTRLYLKPKYKDDIYAFNNSNDNIIYSPSFRDLNLNCGSLLPSSCWAFNWNSVLVLPSSFRPLNLYCILRLPPGFRVLDSNCGLVVLTELLITPLVVSGLKRDSTKQK